MKILIGSFGRRSGIKRGTAWRSRRSATRAARVARPRMRPKEILTVGVAVLSVLAFVVGAGISISAAASGVAIPAAVIEGAADAVVITGGGLPEIEELFGRTVSLFFPPAKSRPGGGSGWSSGVHDTILSYPQRYGESWPWLGEEGEYLSDPNALPIKETNIVGGNREGEAEKLPLSNLTGYDIDTDAILAMAPALKARKDGSPEVLIVHTHTTEAYSVEGASTYRSEDGNRSENPSENVVAVGTVIKAALEEKGIGVIHDATINDSPEFSGAYARTCTLIEEQIKKNPTIRVVLDIHRDAIIDQSGAKLKLTTEIGGAKTAQVMIIVGSDQNLPNSSWRQNLAFAANLQRRIDDRYPGFARPLYLSGQRYNTHLTSGSILVEVGTSGNTLAEAKLAGSAFADVLGDYLNEIG